MAPGKRTASSAIRARSTKRIRTQHPDAEHESSTSLSLAVHGDVEIDLQAPEVVRSQVEPRTGRKSTTLALDLPPLHNLSDIFRSITARALELNFGEFLEHVGSKPLRIVTACSGTESPLLALEMVQENLRKHFEKSFRFQHLFSAEIVPYKQAYIERNFHPRFLFRDVTELKDRVAQTAYGSLEKIPKKADILIAGFSCVDFSSLNQKRKTLDADGESGGTFWGILRHAKAYRPRMIILENVKSAPWRQIADAWGGIDYFAVHSELDTKAYYLPQTRERGYMLCVDRALMAAHALSEDDIRTWSKTLADFRRPASSPASMFMMEPDDRRLEQIENDMTARLGARSVVNWSQYQIRHGTYRLVEGLGLQRPWSKSQADGTCLMPDFTWLSWLKNLPERVWDTLDINFLRKLVAGYDMNHKERFLELSQGVDRDKDTRAYGIVGCITPCGIPYTTTRGGPLCGLEALGLQGLPIDRLILARETQNELQQLAGNAMSSTVIGVAIMSALIACHKIFDKGSQSSGSPKEKPKHERFELCSDYALISGGIQVDRVSDIDVSDIQAQAASSVRYCVCERQSATKCAVMRCKLCEYTACADCRGNPAHDYEKWVNLVRSLPMDFVGRLRSALPARLVVSGISLNAYDVFKADESIKCPNGIWGKFLGAVVQVVGDELRFLDIKRGTVWAVTYEGKFGFLKLLISGSALSWSLYAKPSENEPALCLIREILSKPIARLTPYPNSLLEGEWEIIAPLSSKFPLEISGTGSQVESFEAKCGIETEEFYESTVWSQLAITGADDDIEKLGTEIRGTYDLLPNCGTASFCLHKKPAVGDSPAIYLFLDPTKLLDAKFDSFVFSLEHGRNPGYATRLTIAEVSHLWRSFKVGPKPETVNVYYRSSIKLETVSLTPYLSDTPIVCSTLKPLDSLEISNRGCRRANITLLSYEAPGSTVDSFWKQGPWEVGNPVEYPALLGNVSWLLQKAAQFIAFQDWIRVDVGQPSSESKSVVCTVCAPTKPRLLWGRNQRGQIKAYEDPHDAALYERQIKSRPPPFLVFRRVDEQGTGHLRISLNIQALLHQAYGKLFRSNSTGIPSFSWCLVPNTFDSRNRVFPEFTLLDNRNDVPCAQPPNFELNLRPEQLRSLSWMMNMEGSDVKPFVEEEVEEALLPMLMWRAEGKVCAQKTVRGGVLADEVGYGKTAIILGLIDSLQSHQAVPEPIGSLIPTKATLIIVPKIMIRQWQSEITKFLKRTYRVIVIEGLPALASKSIQDFQQADIVLVSWAVFNSPVHYEKLQQFTGMPRVPPSTGRNFDDWFVRAHVALEEQIQVLKEGGPEALLGSIWTRRQEVKEKQETSTYVPSRRLIGQKYADAVQNKNLDSEMEVQHDDLSSADELSGSSEDEDPEEVRGRVDQLLKLRPQKITPEDTKEKKNHKSDSEDTEYEDDPTTSSPGTAQGSVKMEKGFKGKRARRATAKVLNDHKVFGINGRTIQHWTTVKLPLLHAFLFKRLVIDEFTFANPERLVALLKLQAHSKWVLSGTPPLNDFADANTIAPFLGLHLGVDDDSIQSQNARLKMIAKQRSDAEYFQSLRAPRSEEWHRRRHGVAQIFLDRFTRKNVAETNEIPSSEQFVLVRLLPVEVAVYSELCKQLIACHRLTRRGNRKGASGDHNERLDEIIKHSKSSEEALLKRCSSLVLPDRWHDGIPEILTCSSLIEARLKQLEDLKDELLVMLKKAAWVYCTRDLRHPKFHGFISNIFHHSLGDRTVTGKIYPLVKNAIFTSKTDDWKQSYASPTQAAEDIFDVEGQVNSELKENEGEAGDATSGQASQSGTKGAKPNQLGARKGKRADCNKVPVLKGRPTRVHEFKVELDQLTGDLSKLIREWVDRERSLRYLKAVHLVQSGSEIATCNACHTKPDKEEELNILGTCGHILCSDCARGTIEDEECRVEGCRVITKGLNVINASSLGRDEEDRSPQYGGSKLAKMIEIIKDVPGNERVLLFIQFPELIDVASKALDLAKIKHTAIIATDRKAAKKVEQFQEAAGLGENKVLILHMGSEMAAGLHVHIYHILARTTIDITLFQDRRGQVLYERDGEVALAPREDVEESEVVGGEVMRVVVDDEF
ncbi:hypothetical protein BBP40_007056 [Aspergillus hancockii]|nr:hypothetical protein BBP40_007056 [Aspergillus hancockii]